MNVNVKPAAGTEQLLPLLLEVGCEEIPARFLRDAERGLGERRGRHSAMRVCCLSWRHSQLAQNALIFRANRPYEPIPRRAASSSIPLPC